MPPLALFRPRAFAVLPAAMASLESHASATRAEIETVLRLGSRRPVPLFLPAVYEHKAAFIGSTPSAISRDASLLAKALLAEYEALGPDALTVGVDVYHIEAEAVGSTVSFHEGNDTSIPGIRPGNHAVQVGDNLSRARLPNPLRDGRMPVNVAAASEVCRSLGDDVWLRGAISGPFSLAISLAGAEALFLACLDNPDWVRNCLDYITRVVREIAKGYIDVGAELIVFDSQASPEVISPPIYEEFVLPVTQEFIAWAAAQGVRDVPLIVGGNTVPIAELLCRTGANNLLCDFSADFDEWSAVAGSAGRELRRNISPRLIETSTPEQIYAAASREVQRGKDLLGFIMSTAVIPFGTPTGNILAVK